MKYGFVIDNRKCIGCHACTTACKAEHQVPVGVNRTWVKQVEKGTFPDTRRLFSVMRCNHCTDAPCVDICPVEALYVRKDGIVDFDKDRCIGCKSCMQACPYDALYIDPETHTAAKCNYCAHRIDVGLEPACVNVCPEQAIISGDMENNNSSISQLLARQQVSVRKAEKGTHPNLFYIDADESSLNPTATKVEDDYFWSSQALGVGHYAKEAEKMAFSNGDVLHAIMESGTNKRPANNSGKSIDVLMQKAPKRVYDAPSKGTLWGWEVSAYVLTKAVAAGAFLIPFLCSQFNWISMTPQLEKWSLIVALVFLIATTVLLVKDLDKPSRFLYVLLRPQWKSWLVKGGYALTFYGGFLSLLLINNLFEWSLPTILISWMTAVIAVIVAVYTAFLFAQAKGRDFWQSPTLSIHMLLHSFLAGGAVLALFNLTDFAWEWGGVLRLILLIGIAINLFTIAMELGTPHPTEDSKLTVDSILKGKYKMKFWGIVLVLGNIIPFILIYFNGSNGLLLPIGGLLILLGIYFLEHIWIEAPQDIPLS